MKKILTVTAILAASVVATAAKTPNNLETLSALNSQNGPVTIAGTGYNSSVDFNLSRTNVASWDGIDSVNNIIQNCFTGTEILGAALANVTIETEGGSWLSEAQMIFSNSDGSADPNAVILTSVGTDAPGIGVADTGGPLMFGDFALPPITSNGDGVFTIQFFEGYDDIADAIDANFTSGYLTLLGNDLNYSNGPGCQLAGGPETVPTASNYGLALMGILLLFAGFFSRRKLEQ